MKKISTVEPLKKLDIINIWKNNLFNLWKKWFSSTYELIQYFRTCEKISTLEPLKK